MVKPCVVVVKSTVPVGTCDMVEAVIRQQLEERGQGGLEFEVTSNPEFLKEGLARRRDFMKSRSYLIGLNDSKYTSSFQKLYRPFILDDRGKRCL